MAHDDPILAALCDGLSPWEQAALIAGRQARAIAVSQLLDCGLTRQMVLTAHRRQHLRRRHRGVWAYGTQQLSPLGDLWAAHLAVGTDTAIGGTNGAAHVGILRSGGLPIHVASPKHRRSRRGIEVHHLDGLVPEMVMHRSRLPVLRPEHLLLDIAGAVSRDALAIALNEAFALRLVRIEAIADALVRRAGHPSTPLLWSAVAATVDDAGAGRTHRGLEDRVMLELRKVDGLPPYTRNGLAEVAGDRIVSPDILFADAGVIVELDSRTWHEQRLAMDDDRRRDQQASAAGYVTFRITWHQVEREWDAVVADLTSTLAARTSGMRRHS